MDPKNEITKAKPEKSKSRPAPKKFLFEFPSNEPQRSDSYESSDESENLELEAYIPLILGFDPPQDHKNDYENISDYILRTFNEIHQLVFTGFNEIIPEVFGNTKIGGPKDCVMFFREVILNFCKKFKKITSKKSLSNEIEEYEKLVQKAELRVRDLIRNEQIYRISFDQFTYKHEEMERTIAEIQAKLKEKRVQIEALTLETSKLTSVICAKDEEIRTLLMQSQGLTPSTLIKASSQPESSPASDPQKVKLRALNLQNLKVLLNTSKATPMESSRLTPSVDSTRGITSIKKSARVASPTVKPKSLERTERPIGSNSQLFLKISAGEKLKEMGDALKHRIEILTERRKLDLSADLKVSSPDQLMDNFNFNLRGLQNGSSSQICSQEQSKNKSSPKKLARYDSYKEEHPKSINSARLKPYDDNMALYKTEPADLYESHSATLVNTERKKKESLQYQLQAKRGEYQLLNTTREAKSGTSRARPIMTDVESSSQDKSTEFKNMILKNKQLAYGILNNNKNTSKDKSLKIENRDGKMSPNNPVFMNIMLKKLAGQKSKKGL